MFSISGPQILTYEYDQVGNRTKKIDGGVTTTYNYNGMNQLISLVENGVTTNFTYDANGNMTQKTKGIEWWKYYYDFENRLTKVEYFDGSQTIILGQYYYDGDGKRIKKVEASQTTIYIYLGWNIIFEKESSTMTETKHVFGPNGHVADIKGSTRYYYHSDHLGSLRQETDDAGNAVWSSPAQYEPFGELRSGGSQNEDGYFYTGKLRDYRTGLYYYGNRYYDPIQGRFLTKDILTGSATNSQKWNPYIYVLNNPLRYTDPTGNYNSDEVRFSFAGKNGRIMTWGGENVSGEGYFLTGNGIVKIQIANIGTNSSHTIAPTPTPAPAAPISARARAYMNREEKYEEGLVDVVNSSKGSVSREQAYANKEARQEVSSLVESGMSKENAMKAVLGVTLMTMGALAFYAGAPLAITYGSAALVSGGAILLSVFAFLISGDGVCIAAAGLFIPTFGTILAVALIGVALVAIGAVAFYYGGQMINDAFNS